MCQNETDYNNAIKYLKTSPMFNLSLSSKELFHSNFLYWIAQKDKSAFKALIEALKINIDWPENDKDWEVCREHKNFDLCVCEKETKKELLVIENKFKSLPDKAQLDKYDKKLQNNTDCQKILLSLTEPFIGKQGNWQWKSYQPLVEALKKIEKNDKFEAYDISLIEDYCGFVNNIITLTGLWIEKDQEEGAHFLLDYKADDLKHEEDSESNGNTDNQCHYYNDAKELRIHDLYGKYRTERLRVKLQTKIDNELSDRKGLKIITNTAYTRSLPILEVVIRGVGEPAENNKEPEAFFISIQDNQYRHAINARYKDESTKEDRIESSKDKIKVTEDWHSFLNPEEKPRKGCSWFPDPDSEILENSGQRNNVCSFAGKGGVNYIYQYKKITANATIKQVLDLMVNDVKKIIENFKQE